MLGKLHLICMKTSFHAKIGCNLNDISYLSEMQKNNFQFLYSRRDSPVRGQIYLLKITSIYGNFTPIGGGGGGGGGGVKWLFLGIFEN